ncbi:hypothetical protein CONLIGDRAFT_713069 [Coniochaeta ligniaria NRRL 30616]|uniref:Zn(2)-C6 fungal-type domain-containing protein n=1 Tax=Coniochaeta ligniaria NRRL 30616 TaxID=1408157 RepID=A0A1J7ISF6_9PEZI|nr:hypothetical protein CONLIGDRAFT_713069 [Coniochaeta ligniaria NRRL 30616]
MSDESSILGSVRGCLTCRERHVKCNKQLPTCLQCRRAKRECLPALHRPPRISFNRGQKPSRLSNGPSGDGSKDYVFGANQVWIAVPDHVTFLDVTDDVASSYREAIRETTPSTASYGHVSILEGNTVSPVMEIEPESPDYLVEPRDFLGQSAIDLPSPLDGSTYSIRPTSTASLSALSPVGSTPNSQRESRYKPLADRTCTFLNDLDEARLFRHFGSVMAQWFDVCDNERHFATDVVSRASSSSLLLYACLSVSALHLALTAHTFTEQLAESYHERCVAVLIPMLDHLDHRQDLDILLASTVLLRLFEQMCCEKPSDDLQRHLRGSSAFVNNWVDCAASGNLAEASFWVFVGQDIQYSLCDQSSLRINFQLFNDKLQQVWQAENPLTERSWTHKAVWLLAEAVQYCYSEEKKNAEEYESLRVRLEDWENMRPDSFSPLFRSEADPAGGSPFPTILYTHSWHACAVQHIAMAQMLLVIYDPGRFRMGMGYGRGLRRLQAQFDHYASILFGVALSSNEAHVRFTACHALCASGPWIKDPHCQRALVRLIRETEEEHGWPWTYIIGELTDDWGVSAEELSGL